MSTSPTPRIAVVARGVIPLHGFGGLERSVFDLVTHLSRRGLSVELITPPPTASAGDDSDPFADAIARAGGQTQLIQRHEVAYVTFPFANRRGTTVLDRSTAYPLFGWRAGRVALSMVQAGAIDIVHGFGASVLGYARARRHGATAGATAPLVLNPQGLEEFGASAKAQSPFKRVGYAPLRAAVLACARAADAIIATDRALEPVVERHLHPSRGQVRTIPNGIDVAHADALAGPSEGAGIRARAGIGASEIVILSAGRIEFNKGFDVLAEALPRVFAAATAASRPWRWVLVGDGPFRPAVERAAAANGLTPHLLFTGRVPDRDLHAWYEAATVFVHPTRYEGSSLVTLEAMAHRRAIVATRAGGLPDKVMPGINGWLVEAGDASALATAIVDALSSPERLAAMGAESRRIVEQQFDWAILAGRYLELYDALRQRR